jgi:hypothetical protein
MEIVTGIIIGAVMVSSFAYEVHKKKKKRLKTLKEMKEIK